jgi:ribosome assembly protein SQT1
MAQQDDQNIPIEAEGEDAYMDGEGEMPEGVFIEGEDGEFFGEGEDFPFEQHSEEHMSHTTEEEKNVSEVGDSEALVEDISIGAFREHNDHVYCVTQHPTKPSIFLSGGGDDRALVWDINDSEKDKNTLVEIKEGFKDSIEYIKFNHDSKYVLITGQGNPIRVYKVDESEGKPTFEFKQEMETGEDITFITWHSKANLFLTGGVDMMVWMFNALNGEFSTYAGHEDVVNNAEFTPDGKLIVSISND